MAISNPTLTLTGPDRWQDISNAPTDGRQVLLYWRHEGVTIGHYLDGEGWENIDGGLLEPTHWMALPAPPVPASSEGKE